MTRGLPAGLLLLLFGCVSAQTRPLGTAQGAGARLEALLRESDEGDLRLNPQVALERGDLRYADQFGDLISDAFLRAQREKAARERRALSAIDRAALSPTLQIAYDVFRYQVEFALRGHERGVAATLQELPIDQLFGQHVVFPSISTGDSTAPFRTQRDYENGLSRIRGFVTYLDRSIDAMRRGMAAGHTQPRFVAERVIGQLSDALRAGVEGSPLLRPTQRFPKKIAEAEQARLRSAYRAALVDSVLPALERLRQFLSVEYLPACRTGAPGLIGMKDGPPLYAYLIEQHTTLTLSPDEIHGLGLAEVEAIAAEMERIRKAVRFSGTLQEMFTFLRTDPRFKFKTAEALLEAYRTIHARLSPRLLRMFPVTPRSAFEVRPVPEVLAGTAGGAYYVPGTVTFDRPGVFYVNTTDLATRTAPRMTSLFLHEAIPGHHMQASLSQEDASLPALLRFGGSPAYLEGWGLYAESLGREVGAYDDPYQLFGHLELAMLRAMRLVVDTGLHHRGWTREHAIRYLLEHSSLTETDAIPEVERYIVWPGQALSYKLGELTIRRLRDKVRRAQGGAFDLAAFHGWVLDTGALPLGVLEAKIDRLLAARAAPSRSAR